MGEAFGLVAKYGRIRNELAPDCFVHGATTARQLYARGTVRLQHSTRLVDGDYVARRASRYLAVLDPDSTLGDSSATCERRGMEGSHVVALLREDVDSAYLGYLRKQGISYVLAGRGFFDAALAAEKPGALFGVTRDALMGGGYADGTFAAADVIDELSLVVAPVTSDQPSLFGMAPVTSDQPSLFGTVPGLAAGPLTWQPADVERLPDSGLWLHYLRA